LLLRANSIELRGRVSAGAPIRSRNESGVSEDSGEIVFFRVPLDPAALAEFRSHDPVESSGNGDGVAAPAYANASSWQAFYSFSGEELGIDWQLRLRDLTRKSEWERWKILDSRAVPLTARE
jgi:hypothetical protein